MTGRIGTWALCAGLVVAVAATLLWLRAALHGTPAPARNARRATWGLLAAAATGCAVLEWALVGHDFSVRYVAENGGRHVPLYFTVTSLWAALDGSLLLWLLILAGYAVLLARTPPARAATLRPWAMTVLCTTIVFFFALTYFAANPFGPVRPVPTDGPGPNPLLQEHPAMGVHPPLLYAGYIGMVVPFAYSVAALLAGGNRLRPGGAGQAWLAATRRWTLLAWTFLTAGIVLGAWWSYAVLGWGGYWAWDPVENASLLPWLTATAALHATLARRRGTALTGWTVTLHCLTFLLVLVGTFLTRSGAVASVHSFTESPLGPMLLGFVLLVTAAVAGLLIWRADRLASGPPGAAPLSRETALLGNVVLLLVLAAVVLTGTIFPLISEALSGARAAVGPGYFNRTAIPVALAVLVLMGAAQLIRPGGDGAAAVGRRLAVPAAAGLITIAAVGLVSRPGVPVLAAFGLATFVLTGAGRTALGLCRGARGAGTPVVPPTIRRVGGLLAHAGIAVAATGIAASSGYTAKAEREISIGQTMTVRGVTAELVGVDRSRRADRMAATARLAVRRDGATIATVRPELRYYSTQDSAVSVPAIRSRPAGDIYATVTAVAADGRSATVRLAVNPLVGLVWAGGAITALGGLLALRRPARRSTEIAAPRGSGRRRPAATPAPAGPAAAGPAGAADGEAAAADAATARRIEAGLP
jgi:cytochrome c-type biogenesis protein CcmF